MQIGSNELAVKKSERNYGIDLLRIVAMVMIPVLHILGAGGVLGNVRILSLRYETAWLIEIAAYCAVDVYALISGYVGGGKRQKYSNIIYLYLQVLFYTLITTAIFAFWRPELIGLNTIQKAVFPVAYTAYWYFSAYFCLFFFMPFLNAALGKLEKRTMQKLLISAFVILSVLPTFFQKDFAAMRSGYCFPWLAVLYIAGGYIKKYGIPRAYHNWKNLLGYFLCVIITWLSKLCIDLLNVKVLDQPLFDKYLISYTSPGIVLSAVFLLLFFANIKCGKILTKFICFFAPVSFGVYLFHMQQLIYDNVITGAFVGYAKFNSVKLALAVIGAGLGIWLLGSLVDRVRLGIFNLLRIKKLSEFIVRKTKSLVSACKRKITAQRK